MSYHLDGWIVPMQHRQNVCYYLLKDEKEIHHSLLPDDYMFSYEWYSHRLKYIHYRPVLDYAVYSTLHHPPSWINDEINYYPVVAEWNWQEKCYRIEEPPIRAQCRH